MLELKISMVSVACVFMYSLYIMSHWDDDHHALKWRQMPDLDTSFHWNFCKMFFFDLMLYIPVNNFSVMSGQVFLGWTSRIQGLMCLAQEHNSGAGEALTRSPSVSSQALYHWATVFPFFLNETVLLSTQNICLNWWVRK